jgi:hypothetical protein
MTLKLYTDRRYLPEGRKHTSLLFPFWGNPERDRADVDYGRFDDYTQKGGDFFEIVEDPRAADYLLLPYEYSFLPSDVKLSAIMDELAGSVGKKVLVFFNADSTQAIPMSHAIVFRTSFYASTRRPNEFALPGWSVDFGSLHESITTEKRQKPTVSYCGYIDYLDLRGRIGLKRIARKISGRTNPAAAPVIRGKAVRALLGDRRINTRFVIRRGFWAEGMDKQQARQEYVKNLMEAEYALVARGGGNFSYRLYEALSCGKIPVFINTDCVLPFDHIIDWKKYMVWVEEQDIPQIGDILCRFHDSLSPRAFEEAGDQSRKLYEEWLCPSGFYKNLHKCLN